MRCQLRGKVKCYTYGDRGEWPKALIAGYDPRAGCEYLFAGLDRAIADLSPRPERDRIIIAIHDGQPIWSGPEGHDWNLSRARLIIAEQKSIKPISTGPDSAAKACRS